MFTSRPCSHHPWRTSFLGRLRGLSYGAGHVCSWGRRPCNANPPPQLRKVPCLPVQSENNKELSVAAASGVQCTHQNMSKSHSLLLPPTHLSMRDSPALTRFFFFFSIWPPFQPMKDTYDCRRQCNIRPPRTGDRGLWKVKTEDSLNVTKEPKNVVKVGFMEGKKNDSRWCYVIPCDHVITVKKYNPGRKRTGNVGAKCKIKQL